MNMFNSSLRVKRQKRTHRREQREGKLDLESAKGERRRRFFFLSNNIVSFPGLLPRFMCLLEKKGARLRPGM